MIQFRHVYKTYHPDIHALRNVNLEVMKGDFIYLTGPSGSGKTTLFNLISAIDQSTSGEIIVSGTYLNKVSEKEIPFFRRRVGTVFQDFKLIESKTVFENIALPLEVLKNNKNYIQKRVLEVAKEVGLQFKLAKKPKELSGGEKQRVAIARSIVHHPDILIADEPTGNLDPHLSEEIMDLFEKVNSQGTTVFIATHDHEMVKRRKKRVLRLESGTIFDEGWK